MVSGFLVHGQLVPLLWACGRVEISWQKGMMKESCTLNSIQGAEIQRGRGWGQDVPFKAMSPVTHFF
jgi:hypothetical protein